MYAAPEIHSCWKYDAFLAVAWFLTVEVRCEVIWSVLPFVEDFSLFIDVYCISPMRPMRFFGTSLVVMS